ncbi:hydrogenase [Bacteroidia bacterium]|nr:hydrogenase [Bacteroidia bacterium]
MNEVRYPFSRFPVFLSVAWNNLNNVVNFAQNFRLLNLLILLLVVVLLLAVPFVPNRMKGYAALFASLCVTVASSAAAVSALSGNTVNITIASDFIWGNVSFAVDSLSAWFILIVNLIVAPGTWYSLGYLRGHAPSANFGLHNVMLVWVHVALCMVCMLQNSLAFIFVWEIMSLSSFLLVIFENRHRDVLRAGINYLIQMHISVMCLLTAFLIVYQSEGTFAFAGIASYFATHNPLPVFLLFFAGFGFKAGIVPLHTWLPHAHPAAPSHVSGVMSGVIVKMGIYGIFRIISFLHSDFLLIGNIVLITGMVTGIYGILHASVQTDIKRLLAYCTIENVGLIVMGTGLGLVGQHADNSFLMLAGYGSALFHVLNHALSKLLLFMSAGAVYHNLHTRDMDKMGGLFKVMPRTATLFLIGCLAIAGLPPLNGFLSEFVLFFGFMKGILAADTTESIIIVMAVMAIALIGGLSVLTFTKSFGVMFLGVARAPLPPDLGEPPVTMRRPQYLLVALMLIVILTPFASFGLVSDIVSAVFCIPHHSTEMANLSILLQKVSLVMVIFVALVTALLILRKMIARRLPAKEGDTWGCASTYPAPRAQYTGGSFTKSVGKLFGGLLPFRKKFRRITDNDIFPTSARYTYAYGDCVETFIFAPIGKLFKRLSAVSLHIQDGRLQWYILYGLLFIIAIILLTWINAL